MDVEPAVAFAAIRVIVYLVAGATGAWLSPETIEPILGAVAGLIGVDAATTIGTRNRVTSPSTASELVASVFVGKVGRYIRDLVEQKAPDGQVADGLRAALPVLAEFASSKLNEETRAQIQARVGTALYEAGLTRTRKWGPTSLFVAILLTITVLPGCAALQELTGDVAAEASDAVLGDPNASLAGIEEGLVFNPGEEPARAVAVFVIGDDLTNEDERCERLPHEASHAVDCRLGDVTEATTITVWPTGDSSAYADATYTRDGSSVPYRITID